MDDFSKLLDAVRRVATDELPPRQTLRRLNRVPILTYRFYADGEWPALVLDVVDDQLTATGVPPRAVMDRSVKLWGVTRIVSHVDEIPWAIGRLYAELAAKIMVETQQSVETDPVSKS